jgi:hypothetical protein
VHAARNLPAAAESLCCQSCRLRSWCVHAWRRRPDASDIAAHGQRRVRPNHARTHADAAGCARAQICGMPACMQTCMHDACVFVRLYVCMHACMLYVKLAGSARGGTATPSGISRLTGQHGGGPKSVRLVSAGCGLAGSARARASRVPAHLGSHRRMRFAPRRRRPSIRKRR